MLRINFYDLLNVMLQNYNLYMYCQNKYIYPEKEIQLTCNIMHDTMFFLKSNLIADLRTFIRTLI